MATVRTIDRGSRTVAWQVEVNRPAAELFALVADPRQHSAIDGSGTVQGSVRGPEKLSRGAKFSVGMKQFGVPYRITSTVTDFEDGADSKAIEWKHPLGHSWRWEFEEKTPGVTTVTESFQYGTAFAAPMLEVLKMPQRNADGITKTLERLAR